jgi:hypothetical protein
MCHLYGQICKWCACVFTDLGADGIAIAAVNKKVLEHIIKFLELKATQEPKFVKIFRVRMVIIVHSY